MKGLQKPSLFSAATETLIANLSPCLDGHKRRYIQGVVTLLWPFSLSSKKFSLLLSEPDFRLRGSKGQVKVIFHNNAAEKVSQSGVEIGDTVFISLDGVSWKDVDGNDSDSRGIEWDLEFDKRVLFEVYRQSKPFAVVDLKDTPNEIIKDSVYDGDSPVPTTTIPSITLSELTNKTWSSPAFSRSLARPMLSCGADEDSFALGRGRKRTKFGRLSSEWVYVGSSSNPPTVSRQIEESEFQSDLQDADSPSLYLPYETGTASPVGQHVEHQTITLAIPKPPTLADDKIGISSDSPEMRSSPRSVERNSNLEDYCPPTVGILQRAIRKGDTPETLNTLGLATTRSGLEGRRDDRNFGQCEVNVSHSMSSPKILPANFSAINMASPLNTSLSSHIVEPADKNTISEKERGISEFREPIQIERVSENQLQSAGTSSVKSEYEELAENNLSDRNQRLSMNTEDSSRFRGGNTYQPSVGKNANLSAGTDSHEPYYSFDVEESENSPVYSPTTLPSPKKIIAPYRGDREEHYNNSTLVQVPEAPFSSGEMLASRSSPSACSVHSAPDTQKAARSPRAMSVASTPENAGNMEIEPGRKEIGDATASTKVSALLPSHREEVSGCEIENTQQDNSSHNPDSRSYVRSKFYVDPSVYLDNTGSSSATFEHSISENALLHTPINKTPYHLLHPPPISDTHASQTSPSLSLSQQRQPFPDLAYVAEPGPAFPSALEGSFGLLSHNTFNMLEQHPPLMHHTDTAPSESELDSNKGNSTTNMDIIEYNCFSTPLRSPCLESDASSPGFKHPFPLENQLNSHVSGLRTKLSYFCPLSLLLDNFNQTTDTISVIVSQSSVSRATRVPRDHFITLHLTDSSIRGSTVCAQIFCKDKTCLPACIQGDIVLLRNFKVESVGHKMMLNSMGESSWAVFSQGAPGDVQIKGPPVEFGEEELAYVSDLCQWYTNDGQALVAQETARLRDSRSAETRSSLAPSENSSVTSRGQDSIARKYHRRKSTPRRIVVHELRGGRKYLDAGSPSDKESIHELRDGMVYTHL
ncbi:hypothetical protein LOZ64_000621 [Ophidiomyces ophidiicola]|nr:hypothetical protein LOZ64_000621 [Ophidiomyces ophidiicola]KAI2015843.1 hypothetical protein LOZ49_000428 [Ophidiomyces ophidiicola]KAI2026428.1 hypothetical protein LOZ46_000420 [Ophidiomyces ophidiicola]KAI2145239.1 hypothetical protein LOZ29_000402 [Ophidiomyces ophidiicola]KAI2147587.1 hypothetical protein LOZ28_000102 [Ophidiomyces ophidiicola]